jgi:serine/threonine protein phosphatase PrpC
MATHPSRHLLKASEHLYRCLVFMYPKQFRQTYAREMMQTFRDCSYAAFQQAGLWGMVRWWGFVLYDLVITAPVEHIRTMMTLFRQFLSLEKEYSMADHLLSLDVALRTDTGCKRPHNEDNMVSVVPEDAQVLQKKGALFVVADGMGGHTKGEVASDLAVKIVNAAYYQDESEDVPTALAHAMKQANTVIYHQALQEHNDMGSTCIASVLLGDSIFVANVGDSRAYIIRDGALKQISQDHSWVAEQVRAGVLTAEQARTHERRNQIYRSLGNAGEVEVDVFTEQVQNGDTLVLCTDGLSEVVDDEELCSIVEQYTSEESVARLIACANERGGPDNITAIVARVSLPS